MGTGHWVTHICNNRSKLGMNFKLKQTRLLSRSVQSVSSFRPHACWQNKGLSRSKNKHRLMAVSEATDGWRMWKESVTYGSFITLQDESERWTKGPGIVTRRQREKRRRRERKKKKRKREKKKRGVGGGGGGGRWRAKKQQSKKTRLEVLGTEKLIIYTFASHHSDFSIHLSFVGRGLFLPAPVQSQSA